MDKSTEQNGKAQDSTQSKPNNMNFEREPIGVLNPPNIDRNIILKRLIEINSAHISDLDAKIKAERKAEKKAKKKSKKWRFF